MASFSVAPSIYGPFDSMGSSRIPISRDVATATPSQVSGYQLASTLQIYSSVLIDLFLSIIET